MRKLYLFVTIFVALIAFPARADALPDYWKGTPRFERSGLTYRVKGHDTVIVKGSGRKRVTIPAEVKYRGRWYEVRNVWTGALKGARSVTIHADLDGCESGTLWKKGVRVYVPKQRKAMVKWLKRTGADVHTFDCPDCK